MDGNSNYDKRKQAELEQQKPTKVISGKVHRQKKGLGKKIFEFFFECSGREVVDYVVDDVIKPRIKDLFYDMFVSGASSAIYGDGKKRNSNSNTRSYERNDYENRYNKTSNRSEAKPFRKGVFDIVEYMDTKSDADAVLENMLLRIDNFGSTTVNDYYIFLDQSIPIGYYTIAEWGWDKDDDLNDDMVKHSRQGWYLDLPKPKHIL